MLILGFVLTVSAAGCIGGALSGLELAGKDLGMQIAAMMGAFYGVTAALPAGVTAIAILLWLR